MRLKKYVNGYQVKMKKPEKYKKVNPRTNRIKTFRKQRFLTTDIPPQERSFKNIPKYADGKSKVNFQDWLEIEHESDKNYGKAPNGKWYGWSHRAVYGFKAGDKVTGDNSGKKVEYPTLPDGGNDWDNPTHEPDFVIKNDNHAREVAIQFAKNVS